MSHVEKLRNEIITIFLERFDTHVGSDDVDLLETGLIDSVKIVRLVLEIEERVRVSLPFEELEIEDFRTIRRLAHRVANTMSEDA